MFEFIEMGFALYGIPHTETECGIGNLVWIILKRSLFDKFSLSLEAVAAGMIGQMGLDSSIILLQHYGLKEETRVEYFRGKDFVAFVRNHSELKDILESDKGLEPEDIAKTLLQRIFSPR